MRLEFNSKFNKDNEGINKLIQLLQKKGRIQFDFKKGNVVIEDFSSENLDTILSIIKNHFDPTSLSLNNEKKFKIRNDEKELSEKKKKMNKEISEKPTSICSMVKNHILHEKVFTLTSLREAFPTVKFGTLRTYVNDLKNDNIIVELERGKYALR